MATALWARCSVALGMVVALEGGSYPGQTEREGSKGRGPSEHLETLSQSLSGTRGMAGERGWLVM